MKMKWSNFLSLLLLITMVSCGSEEFGSVPKSTTDSASPLTDFSNQSCSTYTLIKPKVDVLYVVDNSSSSYYIASDIKNALSNTVNSLSSDFDYRVIGTPLLETSAGNNDYQVMTNSSDLTGIPSDSKRISSAGQFSFFTNSPTSGLEIGLSRIISFVNAHKNSLIRSNAYLMVVLVSNGHDQQVEEVLYNNGQTGLNVANWQARLASMRSLRDSAPNTGLDALQLRMISVTPKSVCSQGYRTAELSYAKMAKQLYADSGSTDSPQQDSFDLCDSGGIASIFAAINNSIKQVVRPHEYRYWPITFAENNESVSIDEIKVTKVKSNGSTIDLTRDMEWFYEDRGTAQSVNTREGPNPIPGPGEPVVGRHFIRFANVVTYPDCVLVTSVSRTEYFQYIVLPQKPQPGLTVRINGQIVPESSTNGWSNQTANAQTLNIKAPYPTAADANPPVIRTGFMLKLNGTSRYYKSGDTVNVNFVPAGI